MPSTLRQVAEFCYERQRRYDKRGKFIGRSLHEWADIAIDAANRNKLTVVDNKDKQLIGVCIHREEMAKRNIHVKEVVCVEDAFKTIINYLSNKFPGFTGTGLRGKQKKTYKLENFVWATKNQAELAPLQT